jgi:dihydropteroate synthase
MGILNVTPDSFSDGGIYHAEGRLSLDLILQRAERMLKEGAVILDVGGESTRPGAARVTEQQELDRVIPVVEALVTQLDALVSVDTSSAAVIAQAAVAGASMINDVRALQGAGALTAAAATGLPICLMHMQGEPMNMQLGPRYSDVVAEVGRFLSARVAACVDAGIDSARIILDPGFGFGKTLAHNLELLRRLKELAALGYPLLVGLSRKSMIQQLLGREVTERLPGSLALAMEAARMGASIIRVHDVAPTVDVLKILEALAAE